MEVRGLRARDNYTEKLIREINPSKTRKESPTLPVSSSVSVPDEGDELLLSPPDQGASLSLTARQIVEKINEQLGLDQAVESLSPEQATPAATADRIISGIMMLYDAYTKQNTDVSEDERITKFFAAARSGVDKGYGEAVEILDALGALRVEGVKDGISETKKLLDEKLVRLEEDKRAQLKPKAEAPAEAV